MLQEQLQSGVGYLTEALLPAQPDDVLELDEVWSFVLKKSQRVWLWFALCRRTRQIVAWISGPRDSTTCRKLWKKIPDSYKGRTCFTDFWESYPQVIPKDQHRSCSKHEGETNHIERFNLTLRQSVGRLVRKTLSFSKKLLPHLRAVRLFLVDYNRRKAKQYGHRLAAHLN